MLEEILPELDLVLVMTVNPGFGGQSFITGTLTKIRAIRRMIDQLNPRCELEVDGGIDRDTARLVVAAEPACWWQARRFTAIRRAWRQPCAVSASTGNWQCANSGARNLEAVSPCPKARRRFTGEATCSVACGGPSRVS